MSAFLVSELHVNTLAAFAAAHCGNPGPASVAATLVAENVRSLGARYSDTADWQEEAAAFQYMPVDVASVAKRALKAKRKPDAATLASFILNVADCYAYQACESDDWPATRAAALVETIRARALAMGGNRNGVAYERTPWGL